MIKEILQSIKGVEIYPIISLIIFFLFFIVIGIWLLRMDKNQIIKMKRIPLNNHNNNNLTPGEIHEKNN